GAASAAPAPGLCHGPPPPGPLASHPPPPCRLLDTRGAAGPALAANTQRLFPAAGLCGVPATARAIAADVTVTGATAGGYVQIFPAGAPLPPTSTINFSPQQTRSNNALLALGAGGRIAAQCGLPAA